MLQTIRIQNFRSLEDVTLTLQEVNLLIGPNNSGKSNLFKALEFLGKVWKGEIPSEEKLKTLFFLKKMNEDDYPLLHPISFTIIHKDYRLSNTMVYKLEIHGYCKKGLVANEFLGLVLRDVDGNEKLYELELSNIKSFTDYFYDFSLSNFFNQKFTKFPKNRKDGLFLGLDDDSDVFSISYKQNDLKKLKLGNLIQFGKLLDENSKLYVSIPSFFKEIYKNLQKTKIYSINISNLKNPYPTLEDDFSVNSDASNLVAFFDNMRDSHVEVIEKINISFQECIKEYKSIIFDKVILPKDHVLRKIHGDKTFKKLGVLDKYGQKYWADELSDGTLYFLALLGIIHQPNPPKLILLEEPENGIHPRRIKEIVDFIFDLAESKGIQVIMTTHSTVLIDQFKDLPESIFVFDKPKESTIIKNLQTDIITEDKKQSQKLNLPEIDLSGSLGDHWASGLIGGVPT